jgi:hypothetical protein
VKRCVTYLYKKIQRKRSTNNKPDYREKERYRREKDAIHKRREEEKPKQKGVKWRRKKSERSYYRRLNTCGRLYKKAACDK